MSGPPARKDVDEYCKQLEVVSDFWAASLGCESEALSQAGLTICRKVAADSREGILVFKRGEGYVVKVQEKTDAGLIYDEVVDALGGIWTGSLLDSSLWIKIFNASAGSIVGPAYIGYLDRGKLLPYREVPARFLTDRDRGALDRLAARCPAIEWEHSGIELDRSPIFGCFADGEIVSAASFDIWGGKIAHIRVISDPSYRRRGAGKATVTGCVTRR
jgi:hypothetical protein